MNRFIDWISATQMRATVTATLLATVVIASAWHSWVWLAGAIFVVLVGTRACWSSGYVKGYGRGVDDAREIATRYLEESEARNAEALDAVEGLGRLLNRRPNSVTEPTYVLSVEEVEALMALYQAIPDAMAARMFDHDGDLHACGALLHSMYHWNREHFTL